MREERFSSDGGFYRPPSIVRPPRPASPVSSRDVGRGGTKFMGFTLSGGVPTTLEYPENRSWGYHDDGSTTYLVFNRLGVINYIPIALTGGAPLAVATTTTTPYAVTNANDVLLVDATAAPVVVDLQTLASAVKKIYTFKKIDASANAMTLDGSGGETIDGALTLVTVVQYTSFSLYPGPTGWWVL